MSLYEEHKDMVFRLALSYVRERSEAEDICQAAFVKLLEKGRNIRPGKEKSWLCTVTVNLCRDHLRSAAHRLSAPLDTDIAAESPACTELRSLLEELPGTDRAVLYLFYYEGYSTAEIGKILGLRQTAVTSRLSRARQHLRRQWEEDI